MRFIFMFWNCYNIIILLILFFFLWWHCILSDYMYRLVGDLSLGRAKLEQTVWLIQIRCTCTCTLICWYERGSPSYSTYDRNPDTWTVPHTYACQQAYVHCVWAKVYTHVHCNFMLNVHTCTCNVSMHILDMSMHMYTCTLYIAHIQCTCSLTESIHSLSLNINNVQLHFVIFTKHGQFYPSSPWLALEQPLCVVSVGLTQ